MPALRIVVKGRVQGVGFRFYAQQAARSSGVTGEVWNRSDGAVEAIAEHSDQDVVNAYVEALECGPGYVKDIQSWPRPEKGYSQFEIGTSR